MLETSQDLLRLAIALVILFIGLAIALPSTSEASFLLQRLRDEAHRFAIGFNRNARDKKMTKSARKKLDLIDQILETVKKKVETTANYLPPLIEGMGKLAAHFKDKKTSQKKRKK